MDDINEDFILNDDTIPATFSLHSEEPTRRVAYKFYEPKDLDMLYYTQRKITKEEYERIESVQVGTLKEIISILSNYI